MCVTTTERAERNRKSAAASRARKADEVARLRETVATLRARVAQLERTSEQLIGMFCVECLDKECAGRSQQR